MTTPRIGSSKHGRSNLWLAVSVVVVLHLICWRATVPIRSSSSSSFSSRRRMRFDQFVESEPTTALKRTLIVDSISNAGEAGWNIDSIGLHRSLWKRDSFLESDQSALESLPHNERNTFETIRVQDPASSSSSSSSSVTIHSKGEEASEDDALIDWTNIYFSAPSQQRPFILLGMILWLIFLFAFVGITASDFFCPNLSTIASRLGLSESVAGVTFLAFSNGSPDVFSTFAALSHGSGSLAIGELIGAASFIVSVVAGTMCLIKPFRVSRHTFLRDVGFFTVAITLTLLILYDSHIHLWEAIAMVALYLSYVAFVAIGSWWINRRDRKEALLKAARDEYAEEGAASEGGQYHDDDSNAHTPRSHRSSNATTPQGGGGHFTSFPFPHVPHPHQHHLLDEDALTAAIDRGLPVTLTRARSGTIGSLHSPDLDSPSGGATTPGGHRRKSSIARRPKTRSTVRPSLLGAIEFRDVVNSLRADSSARTLAVFGGAHDEAHTHASFIGSEADLASRGRAASHSGAIRLGDEVPERQLRASKSGSRPPGGAVGDRRTTWTGTHGFTSSASSETGEGRMGSEGPSAHWSEVDEEEQEEEEAAAAADRMNSIVDLSAGVEDPWRGATSPALLRRTSSGSMRQGAGGLRIDIPSTAVTSRIRSAPPTLPLGAADSENLDPNDPEHQSNKKVRKVPSILLTSVNGSMSLVQPAAEVAAPRKWFRQMMDRRGVRIARAVFWALFPSLQDFGEKSYVGKATALLCVPAILLLNLTLPVVDSEEDDCRSIEEKEERARIDGAHDGDFVSTPAPLGDEYDSDAEEIDGVNGFNSLESRGAREAVARHMHQRVLAHKDIDGPSIWSNGPTTSAAQTPAVIDFSSVDRGLASFSITGTSNDGNPLPPSIDPLMTAPPGNDAKTPPGTPLLREPIDSDLLTRWLTAVQCTLGPVFITCALTTESLKWWYALIAFGVGLSIATLSFVTFTHSKHPGRIVLCFVGFVVAAVWILLIVTEVVGVLQTIGHIFGLSDAILGLTIFAMGNSLGDLVANATVARMGFPSMAIAACFGGPMLNILLGIGLSGCYMIARSDGLPLNVQMSRTLMVSGLGLWAILITTLILVPLNGYWMDKRMGAGLIAAFTIVLTTNVVVEIFAK